MFWYQQGFKRLIQKRMMKMLSPRIPLHEIQEVHLELPVSEETSIAKRLVNAMHEDEKLSLLSGIDEFCIPGVPRLGLKPVWTSDATMGIRGWKSSVTDFPASIAMAATFNTVLIEQVGSVIAKECRSLGIGMLLGPGVNLARVPVCGRNFEYFGEDPYLCGELAASYIQGVQKEGVIATVKHFACNNSEYDRHKTNSVVDERSLRELYLPSFKRAIEAGALALMTSYNPVNGIYSSEHPYLLGSILRGEWGFEGLVVSDWNSLYSTGKALKDGVDLEMPEGKYFSKQRIKDAIAKGEASMADVDVKLLHLFHAYEEIGLFSRPLPDLSIACGGPAHRNVAKQVAQEAVVLLKNEGKLLPLQKKNKLVVCIGGKNAYQTAQGGGSSMIQHEEESVNFAQQMLSEEGVEAVLLPSGWFKKLFYRNKVRSCDAVIIVSGFDHIEESEAYDRPWDVCKKERLEIENACNLNPHTILVLQSGGALNLSPWVEKVPAILQAFFLGSQTAEVLTDLLFGRSNPSGKLPYTQAIALSDYRSMKNYPKDFYKTTLSRIKGGQGNPKKRSVWDLEYREALMVGYRHFDTDHLEVLYPFGHGLSYTSFAYSHLELDTNEQRDVFISCMVENTGDVDGSEVVQVYVHELMSEVFRPEQELKGFAKVFLRPGEKQRVQFVLSDDAFSHYDVNSWKFVRGKGQFEIRLSSSSRDIRLHACI